MYNAHKEGKFIPADLTCENIRVNDKEQVPQVSSTASVKDGVVTLSLTNLDVAKTHTIKVSMDGKQILGAKGEMLTAKDVHAYNDFSHPNDVKPVAFTDVKVNKKEGTINVTVPAHSVVTLTLTTK